jgi:hypothetical protein
MSVNIFEDQAHEYLRLNGFFLVRNFVIHFENAQAQEIDLLGIRLPGSVEQTMYSDGKFATLVFQDDERLELRDNSEVILLIGEVTESTSNTEIQKRISHLRNHMRIKYALQRFGIVEMRDAEKLALGEIIEHPSCTRLRLLRILFLINDETAINYQKQNSDLTFISQKHILDFIDKRAKINIKERARTHLPRWLHNSVDRLLQR